MKILPIAILAAMAAIAGNAGADTIYKCTDPDGKVSYTAQPCTGKSKSSTLNVSEYEYEEDEESARMRREDERMKRLQAEQDFQRRRWQRQRDEAAAERRAWEARRASEAAAQPTAPQAPRQSTSAPTGWSGR